MILPDVNVLMYGVNTGAPQHASAHKALESAFASGAVALPWAVTLGLLRLSTRAGILPRPLAVDQALAVTQAWLSHPGALQLNPGALHGAILARLLLAAGVGGPLVSDAHLAALAIEHQATLLTYDRDFQRFAGLQVRLLG